jgi:hypothetical protein
MSAFRRKADIIISERAKRRVVQEPEKGDYSASCDVAGNPLRLVSCAAGWRHLINFLRWIFELRSQSACVLGAQSNAGRKGLINTDCQ